MSGSTKNVGSFGVTADQVYAFVGQVYAVQFFINHEIQRVGDLVHAFVVLFHVDLLGLEHTGFDALLAEELNQCLVLRQALVAAVEGKETLFLFFLVVRCYQALGVGKVLRGQFLLRFHQTFHLRASCSKSWSSPLGTGPEIISGVRASSINTESTSSTIA